VIFGLLAAVGWGLADVTTPFAARKIGSVLTTFVAQFAGLAVLAAIVFAFGLGFHAPMPEAVILISSGFFVGGAGYLVFYRALELGPIALVSPIVAAYAAITILLAVVILHEKLAGIALVGVIVTLLGVFLAATDIKVIHKGGGLNEKGIPLAVVAMVLFGIGAFVLGRYARPLGWPSAVLLARTGIVIGAAVATVVARKSLPRKPPGRSLVAAIVVGIADVGGMVFFAIGSARGSVSITAAAAAAFILFPVIGGLVLFKERPAASQIVGVVVLAAGLVLLGFAG
jgi:drug/metabolite transporter (DMT)-like permease